MPGGTRAEAASHGLALAIETDERCGVAELAELLIITRQEGRTRVTGLLCLRPPLPIGKHQVLRRRKLLGLEERKTFWRRPEHRFEDETAPA